MKKVLSFFLVFSLLMISAFSSFADIYIEDEPASLGVDITAESAVLMEANTGTVLYSKNMEYYNSPASVTKVMTLLLVCEALERGEFKLDDIVSISEYSSSMGGSQVFLEAGEKFTVEELIKCTVIASANDAAVALAELVCGSEAAFAARMNERAGELGLTKTSFENVTGLDDDTINHYSCAYDIAIMSCELIKYNVIRKYSSLWQDTIRDGEFTLTNTNRLVRYYDGCTGLKTGSTDKAGYCISVTASRGDMDLICVVMNAPSVKDRNNDARALLDLGFYGFGTYKVDLSSFDTVRVNRGKQETVSTILEDNKIVLPKSDISRIKKVYKINEDLNAPIKKGDIIGKLELYVGEELLREVNVYAAHDVEKITILDIYLSILSKAVG